jgi:hypothetical protein
MYINYVNDRKKIGFQGIKDRTDGFKLVLITDSAFLFIIILGGVCFTGLVSETSAAQEFHLYETTDQKVILVARDSSGSSSSSPIVRPGQGPSNFPTQGG